MAGWFRDAYSWLMDTRPPPEFATANPPDWLADIRVLVLPPGRMYRFRVQLWPGRAVVESTVGYLCFSLAPPGREEVRGERADKWLGLVERSFGEPAPKHPNLIDDGLPVVLRLFRREPFAHVRQSWNLASWLPSPEPMAGLPTAVQLVAEFYSRER